MSSSADTTRLPDHVCASLAGADLERGIGYTIAALTVGEDGWPSVALLSVGEVVAVDPLAVRLALWPGTRTTANLARDGRVTLMLVDQGVWYVRLQAGPPRRLRVAGHELSAFEARVVGVREDRVTYAVVEHGMSFSLPDRPAVVARWGATVEALKAVDFEAPAAPAAAGADGA